MLIPGDKTGIFLDRVCKGWQMVHVPKKIAGLGNSKSWNGICDESQSLVFVRFLESQIFELFAVKS